MKLSQMDTNTAADVIVRIASPVSGIMHDEKTVKVLEGIVNSDDNPIRFVADNLTSIATLLLDAHKTELFEIVAALSGKTVEQVQGQKFTATILDLRDCMDKELVDFFASLAPSRKTSATE